jgi:signal transduction histidine kinase
MSNDSMPSSTQCSWTSLIPTLLASAVAAVTATLLGIWLFRPDLKDFSSPTMKANTTLGLLLASLALILLQRPALIRKRLQSYLGFGLAAFSLLIGALHSLEYLLDMNFGIDELLVTDALIPEALANPGRMSPIAALCFVFTGIALLLIDTTPKKRKAHLPSVFLAPVFLITFLAVVGYLYGVTSFYKIGPYIRIAWQTAVCFLILGLGILIARPDAGPIYFMTRSSVADMTRRLLIPAILVPVLLGWLRLQAQTSGYVGLELGIAFHTVSLVAIFMLLVGINAYILDRSESQKDLLFARLEDAIRARDDFLSIASHELKTPLTSLKIQTQLRQRLLEKGQHEQLSPDRLNSLFEADNRQLNRINRLIDDMLDISRIRSGQLSLQREEVDLCGIVREVVERFQAQASAEDGELSMQLCDSVPGHWDRFRIEQLISNLISNAVKYGNGKPVVVSVSSAGSFARLSVKDDGPGIAVEDRERIFHRFERAISANLVSGLGLGLYISREIARAHHGRIWVESKPGLGSEFIAEIPLQKDPPK